jgi:glycosyltransferase involved in cell wall biosynthesis
MPLNIAFMTGAYARASDPYLRDEVAHLRALGHTVHTFSVKRLKEGAPSPEVAREQSQTTYLLEAGLPRLFLSFLKESLRSPATMFGAIKLAMNIGWPGLKGRLWPLAYLLEASHLAPLLRDRNVDHLHNHHGENPAAVAMLASLLTGIPYSLTIHGSAEWDRPMELHLDEKVSRAQFVCAISSFTRSQIFRWTRAKDWPKVHVVRCGVGEGFLNAPLTPPTGRTLVNVGRLCEQKGQLLLLEAAGQLAADNVDFQLVFIGDGELRDQLERRIDELNLRSRVRFMGYKDSAAVRQQILDSRAMVMSSFAEALPVVLMEALAVGRPVISTAVAGIPELVEPGVTGWLVPPGSVDHLARAMRAALDTPDDRLAEMGRAGAARAAEQHDAAREAAKKAALIAASLAPLPQQPSPAPAMTFPAAATPTTP